MSKDYYEERPNEEVFYFILQAKGKISDVKTKQATVPQKNAETIIQLLNIESRKGKKLEEMIRKEKDIGLEKDQVYHAKITSLKEIKNKSTSDSKELKEANSNFNEHFEELCEGLKTLNDEMYHKLDDVMNSNEKARERLKILDELEYWKKRYYEVKEQNDSEQNKRLEIELSKVKNSAKKYKTEYLKLRKGAGDNYTTNINYKLNKRLNKQDFNESYNDSPVHNIY